MLLLDDSPVLSKTLQGLHPPEFSTGFRTRPSCRPICSIGGPGNLSQDILRPTWVKCWQIMVILFFCHGLKCPRLWISVLRVDLGKGFSLMFALPLSRELAQELAWGVDSTPGLSSSALLLSFQQIGEESTDGCHHWSMIVHELRPLLRQWRKRGRRSCTRSKPDFHQCQAPHCCNMLQYPPILVQRCANTSSSQHCDQLIWICCCQTQAWELSQQSHPELSGSGVICRLGAGACPQVTGWAIWLAQIWNGMATEQPCTMVNTKRLCIGKSASKGWRSETNWVLLNPNPQVDSCRWSLKWTEVDHFCGLVDSSSYSLIIW